MKSPLSKTALVLTLILTGCQSTPKLVEQQQLESKATEYYLTAKTDVEGLEQRISASMSSGLSRFAPEQVERAKRALADAQDEFDDIRYTPAEADEGDLEDIQEAVGEANTALDSAELIRITAEKELAPTLEMMQILEALDAESHYGREMKRAKSELAEMLEDVADGDLEDARETQAELLLLLRALEVKTVEKRELSELKTQLTQMQRNRVNRVAPISFQGAVASLEVAKSVIAANPRDHNAIEGAVAKVRFEFDHCRHIAQQVSHLRAMDEDDFEAYVLRGESRLHIISQALDEIDRRNLAQDEQAKSVSETIAALKLEYQQLTTAHRIAVDKAARAVQMEVVATPAIETKPVTALEPESAQSTPLATATTQLPDSDDRTELGEGDSDVDSVEASELPEPAERVAEEQQSGSVL